MRCHRERLPFIRQAQAVGLALAQIWELVAFADDEDCADLRPRLRQVIAARLREIGERLVALSALKVDLEKTLLLLDTTCRPIRGDACGCLPSEPVVRIDPLDRRLGGGRRR